MRIRGYTVQIFDPLNTSFNSSRRWLAELDDTKIVAKY
jgi:hypothetical protein